MRFFVRKILYKIIEKAENGDTISIIYDVIMLIAIFTRLIPITIKEPSRGIIIIDYICVGFFIIDYILRWITADIKKEKKSDFIKYPITPMAIIDMLAILPTFKVISSTFRILKLLRVFRAMRIFKTLRYSNNFVMISNVIKKNAAILLSLLMCAIFYIFVSHFSFFPLSQKVL